MLKECDSFDEMIEKVMQKHEVARKESVFHEHDIIMHTVYQTI